MKGSASAPALGLGKSPYAASTGSKKKPRPRSGTWAPPPGAFNEPDLPRFENPGPGRYNPKAQNSCLSTKPRISSCRFGSEDRFKYLGPQQSLSCTSSGMLGGFQPQNAASPGPTYVPKYDLVHSSSRTSSFSVARRETSGVNSRTASIAPGPGLYNPSDSSLSTRRNRTAGGGFLADDRQKYLGEVDPASGRALDTSSNPGPVYKPNDALVRRRTTTTAFGGRGPGTRRKPPALVAEAPGPGSYDPGITLAHGAALSTKPRSSVASFGCAKRDGGMMSSTHCYHGKVPVDMTNARTDNLSPGPGYLPSFKAAKASAPGYGFGTAKRFTRGLAPVKA